MTQEPALSSPVPMKTSDFGSMTGAGTISIVAGCVAGRAGLAAACAGVAEVAGMNDLIVVTEPTRSGSPPSSLGVASSLKPPFVKR
ncbi:hypothetical protein [Mesorhizobium sp.]|uniref:hypothetical protein n=1 Tax=Mesorhizobium sp. TaxID=1871066 RepID=UPI001213CB2A|nr:hypothetical protein [Mesorhizobium sp.]TIS50539.1 MAG: hypothetical protein E5W96_09675 [Mesorhizobium sp.]